MAKDKQRAQEVENMRSNVDMAKHLDALKSEMVGVASTAKSHSCGIFYLKSNYSLHTHISIYICVSIYIQPPLSV